MRSKARWLRGKIELSNETASAEGKQLVAQSHDLPFDVGGSLPRLVMRRARKFEQAGRSLLLIPTQPLAHGGNGGLEKPSRGLDAMLASMRDQAQAMVVSALHFPHQGEVASRHGCGL